MGGQEGRRRPSLGALRQPRTWRRLAWRALLALGVMAAGYVVVTFVQVWATSRQDGARSADVAVVLGAAQYDGRPSPALEGRLDHALALYRDGQVNQIVVTGGGREGDRFTEAAAGAMYLQSRGVPDDDIIWEVRGANTWESLAASARILRNRDLTRAVLVTDGYHALRVDAIAEELGLDASVSPSRSGGTPGQLVRETVAVAVGRVMGFRRMVNLDDTVNGAGPPPDGAVPVSLVASSR